MPGPCAFISQVHRTRSLKVAVLCGAMWVMHDSVQNRAREQAGEAAAMNVLGAWQHRLIQFALRDRYKALSRTSAIPN